MMHMQLQLRGTPRRPQLRPVRRQAYEEAPPVFAAAPETDERLTLILALAPMAMAFGYLLLVSIMLF